MVIFVFYIGNKTMPGVLEDLVFKTSHLPTWFSKHFLKMDLKEPYHDGKAKGLPTAQKKKKQNSKDKHGRQ